MNKVYVLKFANEYGEDLLHEELRFLGIYSSYEKAEEAQKRYMKLKGFRDYFEGSDERQRRYRQIPGFEDYPNDYFEEDHGFVIDTSIVDQIMGWAEGFVTGEESELF